MSTVVVVRKGNEIVIGADTLTKYGSTKLNHGYAKNVSKILKVGENYIAICGNAAVGPILRNYFKNLKELPKLNSVDDIFIMACDLHSELKEKYYLNPNEDEEDSYESSRMDYLIANQHGIYGVDGYRYVEEYTRYSAYGSGYKFALGAMKVAYDLNFTAEEIARLGLEASAEYDDGTDKPFHIYKIEGNDCT